MRMRIMRARKLRAISSLEPAQFKVSGIASLLLTKRNAASGNEIEIEFSSGAIIVDVLRPTCIFQAKLPGLTGSNDVHVCRSQIASSHLP